MTGGGLGLYPPAIALKPLWSGRRGQCATPTPPKTMYSKWRGNEVTWLKCHDVRWMEYGMELI